MNPRKAEYMERFGLKPTFMHKYICSVFLDQLDACMDDDARRLLLNAMDYQARKPRTRSVPMPESACCAAETLERGRPLADWIERMARADENWFRRGRPAQLPPRKPVVSETFVDYRDYRGSPREWRMMRLSERLNRRVGER
jgi:hypothetical protein